MNKDIFVQRRKKNTGFGKIIILIAFFAIFFGGLYWMGGEKNITEQDVAIEIDNDMSGDKASDKASDKDSAK